MSNETSTEPQRLWPMQVVQNCYIVNDLEEACHRLHRLYGIGPFLGGGSGELGQHFYRGQPAPPIEIRGVFVQSGDLNIELVQLLSTTPSAFHDMFTDGAEGFHHVAIFCDDYVARREAFRAEGYDVASEFTVSFGAQICYVDARASLGHMIELYPESAIIRGMYQQTRDAARDWDGGKLIIPWGGVKRRADDDAGAAPTAPTRLIASRARLFRERNKPSMAV